MVSRALRRSLSFVAVLAALAAPGMARADVPGEAPVAPAASMDPAASKPARPPPLPPTEDAKLPWDRHLDVGGDFALVARPATHDAMGRPSPIRYQAATGFALHIRWPLLKYLQVEGYFIDCHLPVTIPQGALGLAAAITAPPVETFSLGARVSPRLVWGRLVGWLTAGVGWGRLEFQRTTATSSSGAPYQLRERGASFVEIPLGFGISWEVIPRWISIDIQATAAFVVGQRGEAFDEAQTVDAGGHLRDVAPFPVMDASLVQTIGLSLLL
jgi:hypothetical protein